MTWRWIKNIGFSLTALLAAVTLFEWGAKFFRYELVAQLEGNAFGLPPQVDDFYNNLIKELDTDTLIRRVLADEYFKSLAGNIKGLSDRQKEDLVRGVARLLPNRFSIVIPYNFKSI